MSSSLKGRGRIVAAIGWVSLLFACLSLVMVTVACSHEAESPTLKATQGTGGVVPDLVCTAQMTTNVVLNGEGFTPLPSKTLEGPTELILPKIELIQTQNVEGGPNAAPFVVPDNPATKSGNVHFISDKQMSIDITEDLNLAGGVYTVRATNPDGMHVAEWPSALALIPPPEVTELVPPAICTDQFDQDITIHGKYFLRITNADGSVELPTVTINGQQFAVKDMSDCTALDGSFTEEKIELCTTLVVTVPLGSLPPGEWDVVITNPGTAGCESTDTLKVKISPPPVVDSVVPANVCSGGSELTITGSGFIALEDGTMPTVQLRPQDGSATLTATAVTCLPDCVMAPGTELHAVIGPGALPTVTYDVVVTNPDGCEDEPPHRTVNGIDGPILFFVDPFVVSNTINTRVTLYSTSITQPLPSPAVWIIPAGQMSPVTALEVAPIDPSYPKRLQAIVPSGQAAGSYDVYLADGSECKEAVLPAGLLVASDLNITLARVEPPFGDTVKATPVTIFRDIGAPAPGDAPFVATPRVFLNPAASTNPPADAVAIQIGSVAMKDPDTLTGVVPGGGQVPPGLYDVVVVNPDGNVGILSDGYTSLMDPPPTIDTVTPPSIASGNGQVVVVEGDDFRSGAVASLTCVDATGASVPAPPVVSGTPTCDGNDENCSMTVTIDATSLPLGSVCVLRITNTDGTYADFSAIGVTNQSLNLATPKPGTSLVVGRRGLAAGAAKATNAARFVFAMGGDDGAGMTFDSIESAPVDLFGQMGVWSLQHYALGKARVFAGSAQSGRYLYMGGGSDGTTALDSVERALVLSPTETPVIDDVDLVLGMAGLSQGQWFYRVSATFDPTDTDNPDGESLASDEFIIKLPQIPNKLISVVLRWVRPKDALGADLPGVSGYRIYRTPVVDGISGGEVLLATVAGGDNLSYTDDGSATPGTDVPLPLGSTGTWAQLPTMSTARSGVALAIGVDPDMPDAKLYLYAFYGMDANNTVLDSYEFLSVDVLANGHQMAANSWTLGSSTGTARWHHGSWVVDRSIKAAVGAPPNDPDTTFVYIGPGINAAGNAVTNVDFGRIQPGGQLDAIAPTGQNVPGKSAGYGTLAAADQLFVFGGDQALPSTKGVSARIVDGAGTLANNSWNAGLNLSTPRVFMGSAVQSAFAFFIAGQTNADVASTTTELVIW